MANELDAAVARELAPLPDDRSAADKAVVALRRYPLGHAGQGRAPARTCSPTCRGPAGRGYSRHPYVSRSPAAARSDRH
jgi:hypothetical protein